MLFHKIVFQQLVQGCQSEPVTSTGRVLAVIPSIALACVCLISKPAYMMNEGP